MTRHPAALLVTYSHNLADNLIELYYVLIGSLHVLESHVEECVHNVCAQVDQDVSVKFYCFVVILVPLV